MRHGKDLLDRLVYDAESASSVGRTIVLAAGLKNLTLSARQKRALLLTFWTDLDGIYPYGPIFLTAFREAYHQGGIITDADELTAADLGEETIIFRAEADAALRGKHLKLGISWTRDQQRAEWFGRFDRYHAVRRSRLLAARIRRDDVLGYFTDREESEIVLDPAKLIDLRDCGPLRSVLRAPFF
jgi:hypothetical protein